jgi:leader peptidase (prepilin peptidase) / N-methyltransferase
VSFMAVGVALLMGAAVGAATRPVVFALAVPRGYATRRACPGCERALVLPTPAVLARAPWGRCRACGAAVQPSPGAPELLGAGLFAGISAAGLPGWSGAAHYWLAGCAIALILIDVAVHRLPDVLTVPAAVGTLGLLCAATAAGEPGSLLRATVAATLLGLLFFVLALAGLGLGDAKLAPATGAILGWHSWQAVLLGTVTGFVLAAFFAVGLLISRRVTGEHRFAYGPFMLFGALAVSTLV